MTDHPNSSAASAPTLTERLIQAAVDYEQGRCGSRELAEARAAVEAAIPADAQPASHWAIQESIPEDGFECYFLLRDDITVGEFSGRQTDQRTRHLNDLVAAANASQPSPAATVEAKPEWCQGADAVCHHPACVCVLPHEQCSAANAGDRALAEQLWAKLCTDCAHVAPAKCDCLDDILEAFALIRAVPQTALVSELADVAEAHFLPVEQAARFLLDRLDEFDPGEDEPEREYHGHVAPAIARLRSALSRPHLARGE